MSDIGELKSRQTHDLNSRRLRTPAKQENQLYLARAYRRSEARESPEVQRTTSYREQKTGQPETEGSNSARTDGTWLSNLG